MSRGLEHVVLSLEHSNKTHLIAMLLTHLADYRDDKTWKQVIDHVKDYSHKLLTENEAVIDQTRTIH